MITRLSLHDAVRALKVLSRPCFVPVLLATYPLVYTLLLLWGPKRYSMRKMSPGIMSPIIFIFLFSYIISAPLVSSLCYTPGGKQQATLEYQACPYSNGVASMCCATNRTNPSGGNLSEAYTADSCLSNGLCQNVGEKTDDQGNTTTLVTYWREMCTISNWSVGGCLSICTDSSVCKVQQ